MNKKTPACVVCKAQLEKKEFRDRLGGGPYCAACCEHADDELYATEYPDFGFDYL